MCSDCAATPPPPQPAVTPPTDEGRCSLKNGKNIFHTWTMFLILLTAS